MLAAGRNHLYQGSGYGVESDCTAQGVDFDMAILHVGESDRTIQGLHVNVGAGDVANLDGGGSAFEGYVAVKFLGAQRAGAGVQRDAGVSRDQNFVIHASGLGVGARQQVRLDFDAVADQVVVDLDFVGREHRIDHHDVAGRWFHRDGAVRIVDGNSGLGSDVEAKFLVGLGDQCPGQHRADHYKFDCAPAHKIPRKAPVGPRSARAGGRELPTLWQRTIHCQLEKHGLFLISLHQRTASFLVVRIGGDDIFGILNVLVHMPEIVGVLRLHGGRLLRDFLQQVVVVQSGDGRIGDHGSRSRSYSQPRAGECLPNVNGQQ